jgi:S-methylmethionine-dependent homocysteine/selenocysteine methylase
MRPTTTASFDRKTILLDGGTGRELLRMGAPFRQPEWSALALIEAPESVAKVHQRYVDSGADVITTNSYAIVPFHLGEERFAADGEALAALAGRLAREVADSAKRPVWVAGSLPPVCGSYRPDLFDAAKARPVLDVLVRSLRPSVDVWLAETISSVAEMDLIADLLREQDKPWWVSYTLEDEHPKASDPRLRSGERVREAAQSAVERGAAAVLFNCCRPEVIEDAIAAARDGIRNGLAGGANSVRVGAYANAFGAQSHQATANDGYCDIRKDLGPAEYLDWAKRWLDHGAGMVGGCCGVGPEHIALLRDSLIGSHPS